MAWDCEIHTLRAFLLSSCLGSCNGHCYPKKGRHLPHTRIASLAREPSLWLFQGAIPLLGQNRHVWLFPRSYMPLLILIEHKSFQEILRSSPIVDPLSNSRLSGWYCQGCIWQQKDYRYHFSCISSRCQLWDARPLCWGRWLARYRPCSQPHGSRRPSRISSLSMDSCWSLPEWRWPIVVNQKS